MCGEEEREGSVSRWAMMSDARSSSGGVEFEKRSRRRDMRRRDVSRGKNQPGGGWIRWPSLEPYVDDQGYLVDPKEVKMRTKILAAALGVALIMAAIHPPPMLTLPRSYLHQVRACRSTPGERKCVFSPALPAFFPVFIRGASALSA